MYVTVSFEHFLHCSGPLLVIITFYSFKAAHSADANIPRPVVV